MAAAIPRVYYRDNAYDTVRDVKADAIVRASLQDAQLVDASAFPPRMARGLYDDNNVGWFTGSQTLAQVEYNLEVLRAMDLPPQILPMLPVTSESNGIGDDGDTDAFLRYLAQRGAPSAIVHTVFLNLHRAIDIVNFELARDALTHWTQRYLTSRLGGAIPDLDDARLNMQRLINDPEPYFLGVQVAGPRDMFVATARAIYNDFLNAPFNLGERTRDLVLLLANAVSRRYHKLHRGNAMDGTAAGALLDETAEWVRARVAAARGGQDVTAEVVLAFLNNVDADRRPRFERVLRRLLQAHENIDDDQWGIYGALVRATTTAMVFTLPPFTTDNYIPLRFRYRTMFPTFEATPGECAGFAMTAVAILLRGQHITVVGNGFDRALEESVALGLAMLCIDRLLYHNQNVDPQLRARMDQYLLGLRQSGVMRDNIGQFTVDHTLSGTKRDQAREQLQRLEDVRAQYLATPLSLPDAGSPENNEILYYLFLDGNRAKRLAIDIITERVTFETLVMARDVLLRDNPDDTPEYDWLRKLDFATDPNGSFAVLNVNRDKIQDDLLDAVIAHDESVENLEARRADPDDGWLYRYLKRFTTAKLTALAADGVDMTNVVKAAREAPSVVDVEAAETTVETAERIVNDRRQALEEEVARRAQHDANLEAPATALIPLLQDSDVQHAPIQIAENVALQPFVVLSPTYFYFYSLDLLNVEDTRRGIYAPHPQANRENYNTPVGDVDNLILFRVLQIAPDIATAFPTKTLFRNVTATSEQNFNARIVNYLRRLIAPEFAPVTSLGVDEGGYAIDAPDHADFRLSRQRIEAYRQQPVLAVSDRLDALLSYNASAPKDQGAIDTLGTTNDGVYTARARLVVDQGVLTSDEEQAFMIAFADASTRVLNSLNVPYINNQPSRRYVLPLKSVEDRLYSFAQRDLQSAVDQLSVAQNDEQRIASTIVVETFKQGLQQTLGKLDNQQWLYKDFEIVVRNGQNQETVRQEASELSKTYMNTLDRYVEDELYSRDLRSAEMRITQSLSALFTLAQARPGWQERLHQITRDWFAVLLHGEVDHFVAPAPDNAARHQLHPIAAETRDRIIAALHEIVAEYLVGGRLIPFAEEADRSAFVFNDGGMLEPGSPGAQLVHLSHWWLPGRTHHLLSTDALLQRIPRYALPTYTTDPWAAFNNVSDRRLSESNAFDYRSNRYAPFSYRVAIDAHITNNAQDRDPELTRARRRLDNVFDRYDSRDTVQSYDVDMLRGGRIDKRSDGTNIAEFMYDTSPSAAPGTVIVYTGNANTTSTHGNGTYSTAQLSAAVASDRAMVRERLRDSAKANTRAVSRRTATFHYAVRDALTALMRELPNHPVDAAATVEDLQRGPVFIYGGIQSGDDTTRRLGQLRCFSHAVFVFASRGARQALDRGVVQMERIILERSQPSAPYQLVTARSQRPALSRNAQSPALMELNTHTMRRARAIVGQFQASVPAAQRDRVRYHVLVVKELVLTPREAAMRKILRSVVSESFDYARQTYGHYGAGQMDELRTHEGVPIQMLGDTRGLAVQFEGGADLAYTQRLPAFSHRDVAKKLSDARVANAALLDSLAINPPKAACPPAAYDRLQSMEF